MFAWAMGRTGEEKTYLIWEPAHTKEMGGGHSEGIKGSGCQNFLDQL